MKRICIQWPNFGPYHLARIRAATRLFSQMDIEVVGLETAAFDSRYPWDSKALRAGLNCATVFGEEDFAKLSPKVIRRGINEKLQELSPDAVAINSYSMPDAQASLRWANENKRVAVLMAESTHGDFSRTAWRERVKSILVNQYQSSLAGGTTQANYLERLGFPRERIFFGYDVVDNSYFGERARAVRMNPHRYRNYAGLESEIPYFLASSRFVKRKNLANLLIAFGKYRASTENPWRIIVLGEGPERQALETVIAEHSIDGVSMPGFRSIEELPAYYGLAHAFVHAPLQEMWGLVVNEAMASGLPVLVSETTGCVPDLVEAGKNGFTFSPLDTDELRRLMVKLSTDEELRTAFGKRSEEIIDRWSPETFATNLFKAIEAGKAALGQRMPLTARLLLAVLAFAARSSSSFHSVEA